MNRRVPSKPAGAACRIIAAFYIGCAVLAAYPAGSAEPARSDREDMQAGESIRSQTEKSLVHLYFADRENYYLMAEQRVVLQREDPANFAGAIIRELIKGPQKGLMRTLPAGTELRAIYLTADRICYVDFSETARKNQPGGCNSELMTIYSIVNSLILNMPEIETVKILIDGNEAPTLAGHIDLQLPIQANLLLIR